MARQVSTGRAVTLRDEAGVLVAVMGLWPEADHLEAWFAAGPALRRRLRSALGLARVALEDAGDGEVRVYVRGGPRVAGARMAAWLGFAPDGEEPTRFGPVRIYRLTCKEPSGHG